MANTKKVILLIFEGPSDRDALFFPFENKFLLNDVRVEITYGDITSDRDSDSSNIKEKVCEIVDRFLDESKLHPEDIKEVIQITDTDGCYIENDLIIEQSDCPTAWYTEDAIFTGKVSAIQKRNENKSMNLNVLSSCKKIKNIDYSLYFMSSSLDHVLFGKLNLSDEEKESLSNAFARKYRADHNGFIKFITKSDFSICDSYENSWEMIKLDNNSLRKFTNLSILFL